LKVEDQEIGDQKYFPASGICPLTSDLLASPSVFSLDQLGECRQAFEPDSVI